MDATIIEVLKILVFSSVLFVWVVRYSNIVEEFKVFGYPAWLRDLVGILKISFVVMLMNEGSQFIKIGSSGIIVLMLCALVTHVKMKNSIAKMLPSLSLLTICALILYNTY